MPPKSEQPGELWVNGVRYDGMKPLGVPEDLVIGGADLKMSAALKVESMKSKSTIELTENGACGTLSVTIFLRPMARKRAVKLLMSKGLNRNESKALVETWGGWYAYHFVDFISCPPRYLSAKMYEYRIKMRSRYSKYF